MVLLAWPEFGGDEMNYELIIWTQSTSVPFILSKLHPFYKFLYGDDVRVVRVNTLVHGDAGPPVHVLRLELRQGRSPILGRLLLGVL